MNYMKLGQLCTDNRSESEPESSLVLRQYSSSMNFSSETIGFVLALSGGFSENLRKSGEEFLSTQGKL